MRRGETWTVSGGSGYAGKSLPVVIVQDDAFSDTDSVTICAFSTRDTDVPIFRLLVAPNARNGLRSRCRLMVDKITTVPKSKLGEQIGKLDGGDMLCLNKAMLVFLGLTTSSHGRRERV